MKLTYKYTVHGFSGGMGYWNGIKEWWFAPEVGIVKFTSAYEDGKINAVWELTEYKGIKFQLISGDYLNFMPIRIPK